MDGDGGGGDDDDDLGSSHLTNVSSNRCGSSVVVLNCLISSRVLST